MEILGKGHKTKLDEIGCEGPFEVRIAIAAADMDVDVVCFGLDGHGKLSDDRYMVYFNQLTDPSGAVTLKVGPNASVFAVNLPRLPPTVERLVFAASIDGPGAMRAIGSSVLYVGEAVFRFGGADFCEERAVIVGEIYLRGGAWRFAAVGQGFAGGLAALLGHFGGTEAPPAEPVAPPVPPAAAPAVVLSKVTLKKAGQKHAITLDKRAGAPHELRVSATWQDNGDGRADNDDLDLRAGLLLPDGRMKIICQPKHAGNFEDDPYVRHLGDVKVASKDNKATETMLVNPAIARRLGGRVALVFSVYSAIGNGAVSVASMRPTMKMEYGEQTVECAFDFTSSRRARNGSVYTYVIGVALIDEDSVTLSPGGQTSPPGSEATPWLEWDKAGGAALSFDGQAVYKGMGGLFCSRGGPKKFS